MSYGTVESKVVPHLVATVQPILSQNATDVVVKRQYFGCSLILMQDRLDGIDPTHRKGSADAV